MKRETVATIIEDLQAGRTPVLAVEDFPAFSEEATAGDPHIGPEMLQAIAATLTEADIPTFERALRAMDEGDLAWLGFKVVYDAAAAQGNVDNEVTKKYGEQGSADGEPLVFFCNDAKEIVASRELSPRDTFQAKDVTRGPSMHNDQFGPASRSSGRCASGCSAHRMLPWKWRSLPITWASMWWLSITTPPS